MKTECFKRRSGSISTMLAYIVLVIAIISPLYKGYSSLQFLNQETDFKESTLNILNMDDFKETIKSSLITSFQNNKDKSEMERAKKGGLQNPRDVGVSKLSEKDSKKGTKITGKFSFLSSKSIQQPDKEQNIAIPDEHFKDVYIITQTYPKIRIYKDNTLFWSWIDNDHYLKHGDTMKFIPETILINEPTLLSKDHPLTLNIPVYNDYDTDKEIEYSVTLYLRVLKRDIIYLKTEGCEVVEEKFEQNTGSSVNLINGIYSFRIKILSDKCTLSMKSYKYDDSISVVYLSVNPFKYAYLEDLFSGTKISNKVTGNAVSFSNPKNMLKECDVNKLTYNTINDFLKSHNFDGNIQDFNNILKQLNGVDANKLDDFLNNPLTDVVYRISRSLGLSPSEILKEVQWLSHLVSLSSLTSDDVRHIINMARKYDLIDKINQISNEDLSIKVFNKSYGSLSQQEKLKLEEYKSFLKSLNKYMKDNNMSERELLRMINEIIAGVNLHNLDIRNMGYYLNTQTSLSKEDLSRMYELYDLSYNMVNKDESEIIDLLYQHRKLMIDSNSDEDRYINLLHDLYNKNINPETLKMLSNVLEIGNINDMDDLLKYQTEVENIIRNKESLENSLRVLNQLGIDDKEFMNDLMNVLRTKDILSAQNPYDAMQSLKNSGLLTNPEYNILLNHFSSNPLSFTPFVQGMDVMAGAMCKIINAEDNKDIFNAGMDLLGEKGLLTQDIKQYKDIYEKSKTIKEIVEDASEGNLNGLHVYSMINEIDPDILKSKENILGNIRLVNMNHGDVIVNKDELRNKIFKDLDDKEIKEVLKYVSVEDNKVILNKEKLTKVILDRYGDKALDKVKDIIIFDSDKDPTKHVAETISRKSNSLKEFYKQIQDMLKDCSLIENGMYVTDKLSKPIDNKIINPNPKVLKRSKNPNVIESNNENVKTSESIVRSMNNEESSKNQIYGEVQARDLKSTDKHSEVNLLLKPVDSEKTETLDYGTIELRDDLRYKQMYALARKVTLNSELITQPLFEALDDFDDHYYVKHTECLSPEEYEYAKNNPEKIKSPEIKDEGLFRNTKIMKMSEGEKTRYHMDDQTNVPSLIQVREHLENKLSKIEKELNREFKDTGIEWKLDLILNKDSFKDVEISDFWTKKECPCALNALGIPIKFNYDFYSHYDHVYIIAPIVNITIIDNKYKYYDFDKAEYKPLRFHFYLQLRIEDDKSKGHDATKTPGTNNKKGNNQKPEEMESKSIKDIFEEDITSLLPKNKEKE